MDTQLPLSVRDSVYYSDAIIYLPADKVWWEVEREVHRNTCYDAIENDPRIRNTIRNLTSRSVSRVGLMILTSIGSHEL